MRDLFLRLIVYAASIAIVAALLPGIHVQDNSIQTLVIVGAILGLVNTFIKPAVKVLGCPLILLTFGLFLLVINGLMLLIVDALAGSRFDVDGLLWAILGGLLMSIIGGSLEGAVGLKDKDKKQDRHTRDDQPLIIDSYSKPKRQ